LTQVLYRSAYEWSTDTASRLLSRSGLLYHLKRTVLFLATGQTHRCYVSIRLRRSRRRRHQSAPSSAGSGRSRRFPTSSSQVLSAQPQLYCTRTEILGAEKCDSRRRRFRELLDVWYRRRKGIIEKGSPRPMEDVTLPQSLIVITSFRRSPDSPVEILHVSQ